MLKVQGLGQPQNRPYSPSSPAPEALRIPPAKLKQVWGSSFGAEWVFRLS